jgi:hypothetical protein
VKVIFSREKEEHVEEYIVPHNRKRRYLAQRLADLTDIVIDQAIEVESRISKFVRCGSNYVATGIKSVKLEVTPYKPEIRKARGFIPLYPWLERRRGIVNIQNTDNRCFWKCFYRALMPDQYRNYYRDVLAKKLQEFMDQYNFDPMIFKDGYTISTLATFEERYKISINIYDIGKDGPEQTKQYYCSIYNGDSDEQVPKVNLGILRNDQSDVHFVLIKKLHVIFTSAYDENHGHVKMCQDCGIVCSTTEQLLRHYQQDHREDSSEQQIL